MPSLIFQNVQFQNKKEIEPSAKSNINPFYEHSGHAYPRGSTALLWSGVLLFTLVIVFLWGWAFKIRLDSFSWDTGPENALIDKAQDEWNKNFDDSQKKALEDNKNKIQDAVKQIITTFTSTSTTSTLPSENSITTNTTTQKN